MRASLVADGRGRTAADIMTAGARTCSPSTTVLDAAVIARGAGGGAVPVVDEGRTVGLVTDRELARALTEDPDLADRPVFEIMGRGMVAVLSDDSLVVVEEKFGDPTVRLLLVIDPEARPVGIITRADLAPHPAEEDVVGVVEWVSHRERERGG
jgi:CBS domain-containing protein